MKKNKSIYFIGRSTIDHTYLLHSFPEENTKMFAEQYKTQYGGPALNAAITNSLLGNNGVVVSCFGSNKDMQKCKDELTFLYDLELFDLAENKDFKLPESAIFVNKSTSSRTIINSPRQDELEHYSFEGLYIEDSSILLLDGYIFSIDLSRKIQDARKRGCIVILDGGSWKANTNIILDFVDIAVCSTGFCHPGKDRAFTIKFMKEKGVQCIAFTNDENEIHLHEGNSMLKVPVQKVKAIDTLGAGDVLHGAFCFYLSEGNTVYNSLCKAAVVATESCKYFGTHTWKEYE